MFERGKLIDTNWLSFAGSLHQQQMLLLTSVVQLVCTTAANEEFLKMEVAYENPLSNNRERKVSIIECLQLMRPLSDQQA